MTNHKQLKTEEQEQILTILQERFEKHPERHEQLKWADIEARLLENPDKLWSLNEMEKTGGEPDVLAYDAADDVYYFFDCVKESPKGRRSVCYDQAALEARKKHKPETSALKLASEIGIELLTEDEYRFLQQFGPFDTKTSSWIQTPEDIRALGGAVFCDYRYGTVFYYHNGADSYYSSRGFRGVLKVEEE